MKSLDEVRIFKDLNLDSYLARVKFKNEKNVKHVRWYLQSKDDPTVFKKVPHDQVYEQELDIMLERKTGIGDNLAYKGEATSELLDSIVFKTASGKKEDFHFKDSSINSSYEEISDNGLLRVCNRWYNKASVSERKQARF